jgi:hypothetical protein
MKRNTRVVFGRTRIASWAHTPCQIFALLAVCAISSSLAYAQLSQADLNSILQDEISQKHISVQPLQVSIEHDLVVQNGGERLDKVEEPSINTILLGAATRQLTAKQLLNKTPDRHLQQSLVQANERATVQIDKMLSIVNDSTVDESDRISQLQKLKDKVDSTYDTAVADYAKAMGLQLGYGEAKAAYKVAVSTKPIGGVVRYLPAGEYDLYELARRKGKNLPEPTWITPADPNNIVVSGYIWFVVQWVTPQKLEHRELLYVSSDVEIELTPDAFHNRNNHK